LLRVKPFDPDSSDENGHTPLLLAAQNGHEGAVKLLLVRSEVNPGLSNKNGQIALLLATKNGHQRIVEQLRDHSTAKYDINSYHSQTSPPALQPLLRLNPILRLAAVAAILIAILIAWHLRYCDSPPFFDHSSSLPMLLFRPGLSFLGNSGWPLPLTCAMLGCPAPDVTAEMI
ncbi:hypothetical protein B9Z19DRAFT_966217, partial [Tuber borchii]